MAVLDSSAAMDFLLGIGSAGQVEELLGRGLCSAPDVLVFEVLAVIRRQAARGVIDGPRADAAVADLGDLPVALFPSLLLRARAWELRANMTIADGLFVSLAELLNRPLATRDRGLAEAARRHSEADVIELLGD